MTTFENTTDNPIKIAMIVSEEPSITVDNVNEFFKTHNVEVVNIENNMSSNPAEPGRYCISTIIYYRDITEKSKRL